MKINCKLCGREIKKDPDTKIVNSISWILKHYDLKNLGPVCEECDLSIMEQSLDICDWAWKIKQENDNHD